MTLPVLLFLVGKVCGDRRAAVPCDGHLFGEMTSGAEHMTGWMCPDYSIHWTKGPVEQHYQCLGRHRAVTPAGHVLMTKD